MQIKARLCCSLGLGPEDLCIYTPNGAQIEQVSHYKYLGIWFDDKLFFETHFENLTKNLRSMIVFFYQEINPASVLKIEGTLFNTSPCNRLWWHDLYARGSLCFETIGLSIPLSIPFSNMFYHWDSIRTHRILHKNVGWTFLSARRELHSLWHTTVQTFGVT